MPQPYVRLYDKDHSWEPTSVSFNTPDIDNLNFENYRDNVIADLAGFLQLVSYCQWANYDFVTEVHTDVGTLPSSPYAQRERRAIIQCVDNSEGNYFDVGIPAPDMSDMAVPGTDVINLQDVEVAAYVTALETWAVSPAGNALTVVKGIVKGVNN